MGMSRPETRRG